MTLDTLTRASAEVKHARLKSSLAQSRAEFRDRFRQDAELFRTLPSPASFPLSPISHPSLPRPSTPLLGEDLVRSERLNQCCKRVRIWRRQTTNPLLVYKQQQLTKNGGVSVAAAIKGSSTTAADHRMHLSLLMTTIVDIYEQKVAAEASNTSGSLMMQGSGESFPEFAIKYIATRAPSRRGAVEQINSVVGMLLQRSSHPRVRTFASLCGVDDKYNPPEKLRAFLHMLESVHRLKVAFNNSASAGTGGGSKPSPDDSSSLSEVVFYNLGVPLTVAHRVITELFEEEYYWNFRFWNSHFQELKLNYTWPPNARCELEEKALALTAVTRNAALNAAKKIDGDAFLELLLETWTQRAKLLADMLEAATDSEEAKSAALLVQKQVTQDARGHIAPLSPEELHFFDELVDEFWNAEVPWTASAPIQRRVDGVCRGLRSIDEVAKLYRKYVAELDESRKVWLWAKWPWDVDWEWGLLVVKDSPSTEATSTT